MYHHRLFVASLLLCCGFLGRASSQDSLTTTTTLVYEHCGNLPSQENIQIKLIAGVWYVIEILQHKTNEIHSRGEYEEIATCPSIYLTLLPGSESELKLSWDEDEGNVEYRFKINDKYLPGHWSSTGGQNDFTGSLVMMKKYKQFAGSVFVKKAVSDHMVLTFCSPNEQLYSVVVARDKSLDAKELKSIKDHMQKIKLPITQTTRTCRNSSSVARAGRLLPWIIVAATLGFAHFRTAV